MATVRANASSGEPATGLRLSDGPSLRRDWHSFEVRSGSVEQLNTQERLRGGDMTDLQLSSVLDKLGAVKDTMTVTRVFGESYQVDGVTMVPVATVRGGGGGGGGEGSAPGGEGTGTGAGLGFGVIVRPLGVYIVKGGEVSWQPAIDALRVIVGGQLLAIAEILALRGWRKRR